MTAPLPDRLLAAKFRKRPLVIEAIQYIFDGTTRFADEAQDDIADFMGQNIVVVGDNIEIQTPEGPIYASPGDWIIRGVAGEFYPCKPDIFTATYEAEAAAALSGREAVAWKVHRGALIRGYYGDFDSACAIAIEGDAITPLYTTPPPGGGVVEANAISADELVELDKLVADAGPQHALNIFVELRAAIAGKVDEADRIIAELKRRTAAPSAKGG